MVNGLLHARRKDALELGKALAKASEAAEKAEAEAKLMHEAMHDQQAELASMQLQIAEYKARLGL